MKKTELNTAINKFLSGNDMASYRVIYQYYFRGLCLFAYEYLKDKDASEDIVQDVFVHLLEVNLNLRKAEKFTSYIFTMVRSRCLNQIRGKKVRQAYEQKGKDSVDWESDIQQAIIKSEVFEELEQSLRKLPELTREIFELSYLTQLKGQDIADRLGLTIDMVKAHRKKARKILRHELNRVMSLIIILNI